MHITASPAAICILFYITYPKNELISKTKNTSVILLTSTAKNCIPVKTRSAAILPRVNLPKICAEATASAAPIRAITARRRSTCQRRRLHIISGKTVPTAYSPSEERPILLCTSHRSSAKNASATAAAKPSIRSIFFKISLRAPRFFPIFSLSCLRFV